MKALVLAPLVCLTVLATACAGVPSTPAVDVPRCLGQPATIVGTAGNDDLEGTEGPDVIWAGPGWDNVNGNGGDDVICLADVTEAPPEEPHSTVSDPRWPYEEARGGPGNDRIQGGRGATGVGGGPGDDEIWSIADADFNFNFEGSTSYWGGSGDDVLHGNDSPEEMWGGAGNDRIEVGSVSDRPGYWDDGNWGHGGPGDDVLIGGNNRDLLVGGRGNDRIEGNAGDDRLFGDKPHAGMTPGTFGDDVLLGGPGADEIYGLGGNNQTDGGRGSDACVDPNPGEPGAVSCEQPLTELEQREVRR